MLRYKDELFKVKVGLWGLLAAAGLIVCVCTLIGFAGRLWWLLELFSHFRPQYLISLTLISLLLLLGRRFRVALVMGLFALVNLALILPYHLGARTTAPANAQRLRLISINVNTANKSYELVRQYVLENNPDILVLIEVNEGWIKAMAGIESLYPYRRSQPRSDNFGIALYSKLACGRCEVRYFGDDKVPSVVGEFQLDGKTLTLVGTHPLPPIDALYARARNNQLAAVAGYMSQVVGPKVVLGDLNATPWSPQFGALLEQASLRDSARGFGLQLTWPTDSVILRLPIDHCLVSSGIEVLDRRVGPNVGSDHFPILIDFVLRE